MIRKKKKILGMAVVMSLATSFPLFAQMSAEDAPETIEIGSIAEMYEPVVFDHAAHVLMVESCSFCHHHTTGTAPEKENCAKCHQEGDEASSVACVDCHEVKPFSSANLKAKGSDPLLYHVGRPGLKGAYHQNCIGCHEQVGAPTGCQDCHARNDKGDQLFHSGKYAPEPGKTGGHH
ncbi:MAG: cytochrome c3 family protein [Desulfobulbaceae bacterium]|uniref:Cytochrome c3 family protein n=1 Tax=Candidatus Desulfobia pelagia TaxID=2841692 RepID=A0A8J6NEJ5_9BACT|nr:cytochrome c3 family protein [Candidatus Desulfobia pelagia]